MGLDKQKFILEKEHDAYTVNKYITELDKLNCIIDIHAALYNPGLPLDYFNEEDRV